MLAPGRPKDEGDCNRYEQGDVNHVHELVITVSQ
jgi:hypothetical protein